MTYATNEKKEVLRTRIKYYGFSPFDSNLEEGAKLRRVRNSLEICEKLEIWHVSINLYVVSENILFSTKNHLYPLEKMRNILSDSGSRINN